MEYFQTNNLMIMNNDEKGKTIHFRVAEAKMYRTD